MTLSIISLPDSVPSNKFSIPRPDPSLLLNRENLLDKLPQINNLEKVLLIEAQAGQGKTTLVYQYLLRHKPHIAWYQMDREDSDAIFFLSALHNCFRYSFPHFSSPQLIHIFNEGSITASDLKRCINILLNDLSQAIEKYTVLVIEDFHRSDDSKLTNQLISYMVETSPPKLKFIITSRHPISIKCKYTYQLHPQNQFTNDDLALSQGETEQLLTSVLNNRIQPKEIVNIQRITKGWIMGVLLATSPFAKGNHLISTKSMHASNSTFTHKQLLNYFHDELFSHLNKKHQHPLLLLSLLDEIPLDLAEEITGSDDITKLLKDLVNKNHFTYSLADQPRIFRFHQLFQEFLQHKAKEILTEDETAKIHLLAADHFFKSRQLDKAMICLQQGGYYEQLEEIMKAEGLRLFAKNRTISVHHLLQNIPHQTLLKHGWLSLFRGILKGDFSPLDSLDLFESCRKQFRKNGDEAGELLALAQIIHYHVMVSGQFSLGTSYLDRTESLFTKNLETLENHARILIARNLASGFCFFSADLVKAKHYATYSQKLAARLGLKNLIVSSRFILGYIELFSGNNKGFLHQAEKCQPYLSDPLVGTSNKMTIRIIQLYSLSMHGDMINFDRQKSSLLENIDPQVVKQTMAAPYLYIWSGIVALSQGNYTAAEQMFTLNNTISETATTKHMASQFMDWQAYGEAITGKGSTATHELLNQATDLRMNAGGPFHIILHSIIKGSALLHLGDMESAKQHLNFGCDEAELYKLQFLLICAQMQRGLFFIRNQNDNLARKDIHSAIVSLKRQGFTSFWGITPEIAKTIVNFCVKYELELEFISTFADAHNCHISITKSTLFPVLKFHLLDGFKVTLANKTILSAMDFSPSQKHMLGHILTNKNFQVNQEEIQFQMWPDSPPNKARKSLDALLDRLRKTINPYLPVPAKEYILLKNSVIVLQHSQVDTNLLLNEAQLGFNASNNNQWWQASIHYTKALSYWKSSLPDQHIVSEEALKLQDSIINTLRKIGLCWGNHLIETHQHAAAAELLEDILPVDKTDAQLVKLLYTCYSKADTSPKCWSLIDRYRKALTLLGYNKKEIETFYLDIIS